MKKSVEALLKKMIEDKTFAEKIISQTEREKVIEIARNEGIEIISEDIDEANEAISKALQVKKEGELTDEELESVAGGSIILTAITSVATVSASTVITSVLASAASAISASAVSAVSTAISGAVYIDTQMKK